MLKQHYQDWFTSQKKKIFEDFFTFLRFRSISTDPAYRDETKQCAQWLVSFLKAMHFEVELWTTSDHPVLFASCLKGGPDAQTLLFYQHYDVQPAVPLDEWITDPFEPTVRDGKVFARGAVDNKGQCFYILTALRAFLESPQAEKVNLKVLIEGGEEIGSMGLEGLLEKKKEALAADRVFVTDFGMLGEKEPAVTLGMRGIATLNVLCRSSNADLHSGLFGGIVMNPARALIQALNACFNDRGGVAIPGFYDGVKPFLKKELKDLYWNFDVCHHTHNFAVSAFSKEEGYSLLESNWIRPTLEVNGLESGYTGEGEKTIIPATAMVKLSCRLVPNQDPHHVIEVLCAFLKEQLPEGVEITFEIGHGGPGYLSPLKSKTISVVSKAYEEVFQAPCRRILCGATVPIIPKLAQALEGEIIMMGVGIPEDGIHSPNESFGLKRFEQGFLSTTMLLEAL